MTDTVLLVIDAQQSFYERGYNEAPETPAFEKALNTLVAGCQAKGIPVVDVFHVESEGAFAPESGLVVRLPFLDHEPVASFRKKVHNALTESGLQQWLEQNAVKHVIITGLRSEQCCETTARVASDFGYHVTYVTEATLTFPITHDGITLSIADLRHRTESVLINRFADIRTVEGLLQELA